MNRTAASAVPLTWRTAVINADFGSRAARRLSHAQFTDTDQRSALVLTLSPGGPGGPSLPEVPCRWEQRAEAGYQLSGETATS